MTHYVGEAKIDVKSDVTGDQVADWIERHAIVERPLDCWQRALLKRLYRKPPA